MEDTAGESSSQRPPGNQHRRRSSRGGRQPSWDHVDQSRFDANITTPRASRRQSGGFSNGQNNRDRGHQNPYFSPRSANRRDGPNRSSNHGGFRHQNGSQIQRGGIGGPNHGSNGVLSPTALQEFLQSGIEHINGSDESRHAFLEQLASETGLEKVRQLLEADYSKTYSVLKPTFGIHCISFLRILSNPIVVRSLSLEQQIRTVYNVVYGFNGERAIPFFEKVLECLEALKPNDEIGCMEEDDWIDAVEMTTTVFLNTLRMNQSAALQERLGEIGEGLTEIAPEGDRSGDETLRLIAQNIANINSIFSSGQEVPFEVRQHETRKKRRTEEEEDALDYPGELSLQGPRHDNDHSDISKITILPTISEIQSNRPEFLPTKLAYEDEAAHHQQGIKRLIDIQYRLLREDTSGQLRNSTRFILKHWDEVTVPVQSPAEWHAKRKLIREGCPTPLRLYFGADIQKLQFQEIKSGMEVVVEFDQPRAVRRLPFSRRQMWWRKSTELRENKSVIALIERGKEANVVFLVVCKRNVGGHNEQALANQAADHEIKPIDDLATNPERAIITLRLITLENEAEQESLIRLANRYHPANLPGDLLMIEFPAVIYRSFEGILRCLKLIHANPTSLPFSKWLSPHLKGLEETFSDLTLNNDTSFIPPPAYLLNQHLDLSACCLEGNNFNFSLADDPGTAAVNLAQRSTLDHGQAKALISAFRHEIALTQGPPGCGKSYVGVKMVAALLANKARLNLGPILCICYTNHALDQFLNELLKLGIKSIVRIGSPSPLPHIEALSFESYKKSSPRIHIPSFGSRVTQTKKMLIDLEVKINDLCTQLEVKPTKMVTDYLNKNLPNILRDIIDGAVLYGYDTIGEEDEAAVELWIAGSGDISPEDEGRSLQELLAARAWGMTSAERYTLFQHCHKSVVDGISQKLQQLLLGFAGVKKNFTALFLESDRKYLEQIDILGITTVGLVNNSELVRTLPAKVMVCEEAGEVLESHVLTALLPSIQHMILIGDHLQLRPKISTLALSKEYERRDKRQFNLDESLFERLASFKISKKRWNSESNEYEYANTRFPIGQLDIQRRMHPDIANLVRKTLYPELHDNENTVGYPEIAGIKRRLFWLDHQHYEDPSDSGDAMQNQSKTNTWEVKMVVSLVTYLARQGIYKDGEIAVLTPYINQMRLLMEKFDDIVDYDISERDWEELEVPDNDEDAIAARKKSQVKKSKVLDRIRIATVDNFQGEEATIIIVSLVRSNERKNCGFLKTPNRINVLLSRAKHGMYIIGDASTAVGAPMWQKVITLLEEAGNIGPKLQLVCSRHPNKKTLVGCPEDFETECPEGGCSEKCGLRLSCGHICDFKCHPKPFHDSALCMKECARPRDCGHPCRLKCKDPCGECKDFVYDVGLPCGHIINRLFCCRTKDLSRHTCTEMVQKIMPQCGHELTINCFLKDSENIKCTEKCGFMLSCGHLCQRKCSECTVSGHHAKCTATCRKEYQLCGHKCSRVCHDGSACPSCTSPCELRCKHARCPNKCGEACYPCAEVCGWECEHQKEECNMPCSVPCEKVPCNKRCEKMLSCKHRCPSVCGEKCPGHKYCQICASATIKNQRVDFVTMQTYQEIDLDEDPIIVLRCGHVYTMSSLDGFLELSKHYTTDEEVGKGRILMSGESLKGCPDCRRPFRDINRYNRVFKSVLLDELTRRFVARSTTEYAELMGKINTLESGIEAERAELVEKLAEGLADKHFVILSKYKGKGRHLRTLILQFNASVSKTEQPLTKVNDLYNAALAKRESAEGDSFNFDQAKIQTGLGYRGKCLEAKAKWVILSDWHAITNLDVPQAVKQSLRDSIRDDLKSSLSATLKVSEECRDAHLPSCEVEARIYHALFTVLNISNEKGRGATIEPKVIADALKKEEQSLRKCDALIAQHPGTLGLLSDLVQKAKIAVNGGVFYTKVTSQEEQEVIAAMAAEFNGGGHWYYCVNGHPFTIGECGMPMELARCPECGNQIGGQHHVAVEGVRLARRFEGQADQEAE